MVLLSCVPLNAQFGKNVELHQFKINVLAPGLEYEVGIGENSTLDFKIGLQAGIQPDSYEDLSDISLFAAATTQYRYYHNLEKRFSNRKFGYGNSGNYIAASASVFGQSPLRNTIETEPFAAIGPVYGIQRGISAGLTVNLELGASYYLGDFSGGIYPTFNFTIGWILGEKRWCVGK